MNTMLLLLILVNISQYSVSYHILPSSVYNNGYYHNINRKNLVSKPFLSFKYHEIKFTSGTALYSSRRKFNFVKKYGLTNQQVEKDVDKKAEQEVDVTYLSEEKLRSFWIKSGYSNDSYNENSALTKLLLSDEDDDDNNCYDNTDSVKTDNNKNEKISKQVNNKSILLKKKKITPENNSVTSSINNSIITQSKISNTLESSIFIKESTSVKKILNRGILSKKEIEINKESKIDSSNRIISIVNSNIDQKIVQAVEIPAGRSVG